MEKINHISFYYSQQDNLALFFMGKRIPDCSWIQELIACLFEAKIYNPILAGHETTQIALSNALYYLSVNPLIQEKAQEEVTNIMGNDKENIVPTIDQIKDMKYIMCIIKEVSDLNSPYFIYT